MEANPYTAFERRDAGQRFFAAEVEIGRLQCSATVTRMVATFDIAHRGEWCSAAVPIVFGVCLATGQSGPVRIRKLYKTESWRESNRFVGNVVVDPGVEDVQTGSESLVVSRQAHVDLPAPFRVEVRLPCRKGQALLQNAEHSARRIQFSKRGWSHTVAKS